MIPKQQPFWMLSSDARHHSDGKMRPQDYICYPYWLKFGIIFTILLMLLACVRFQHSSSNSILDTYNTMRAPVYRSAQAYPGTISSLGKCSPLSLAILGHAKAGTTDLYNLLMERSNGMFIEPRRKESGCFGGYMSPDKCIEEIRGPATCLWDGRMYRNLTIDAAPIALNYRVVKWGALTQFYHVGFAPASIIILREPISMIQSLYNHWMWPNLVSEESCQKCSLEKLVLSQLKWLAQENVANAVLRSLDSLESGHVTMENIELDKDVLIESYRENFLPPECHADVVGSPRFEHPYVLDSIYELKILPFFELMSSKNFLILDFSVYSQRPDIVRDTIFEMLLGTDIYLKLQEENTFMSWMKHDMKNVKSNKRDCSILSDEAKCMVAKYLSPFDNRLFGVIERLQRRNAISVVSFNHKLWWDSPSLYC